METKQIQKKAEELKANSDELTELVKKIAAQITHIAMTAGVTYRHKDGAKLFHGCDLVIVRVKGIGWGAALASEFFEESDGAIESDGDSWPVQYKWIENAGRMDKIAFVKVLPEFLLGWAAKIDRMNEATVEAKEEAAKLLAKFS